MGNKTVNTKDVWEFTFANYSLDGVAPYCLSLQETCGLDVNMLFFMFYLGQQGKVPTNIDDLLKAVAPWRDNVIIPLRQARRFMKGKGPDQVNAIRERIKAEEINAEAVEQALLCDAVLSESTSDALAGVKLYLSPAYFSLSQNDCEEAIDRLCKLMGLSSKKM